ncbi:arabinosyltransferase domain-containing protein, partial [Escherichia coli]|nr:arabinosyltransferase domain-containing protein [Escherichia coli]
FPDPNLRPQIVGVFTDLTGPAPPGLAVSATIDTRFSTRPTTLKLLAIIGAIVATVVALIALWRLDQLDGRGSIAQLLLRPFRPASSPGGMRRLIPA